MSSNGTQPQAIAALGQKFEKAGTALLFIALGLILIWFGGIKFTAGQAEGMFGMISNNPLVSWMYTIFSKQGLVYFLGSLEIIMGLLILCRFINPLLSAIGGLVAISLFTVSISMGFFLTGMVTEDGFPVLSFLGEFILKDACLIATAVFIVGNSLKSIKK